MQLCREAQAATSESGFEKSGPKRPQLFTKHTAVLLSGGDGLHLRSPCVNSEHHYLLQTSSRLDSLLGRIDLFPAAVLP